MVKEAMVGARKCSHCGHNGHNARTCTNGVMKCVKLFGVNISEQRPQQSLRKSLSLGNLPSMSDHGNGVNPDDDGYLSDGQISSKKGKAAHERKKGKPWTEEEHLTFLAGLKNLGRGDWRGISKNYVISRSPTQVASHAQKYFLRQASNDKKKRRSSVFDVHFQESEQKNLQDNSPVTPLMETAQEPVSHQAASSSSAVLPLTTAAEQPSKANPPHEIANQFHHLSMDYQLVFHSGPPCHNIPSVMSQPNPMIHYNSARMVHPSGIPNPRYAPIGTTPLPPVTEVKDGLELKMGRPRGTNISSQGAGAIHVT